MPETTQNLEVIWDELAKTFNNWAGVKPNISWVKFGVSERAGAKRLRVLENGKSAKTLYELTKNLTQRDLRYLHKRAEVNFEQAQAAGRVGTILNGTLLVGAVVLLNQIFPGAIAEVLKLTFLSPWGAYKIYMLITSFLAVLMSVTVLSYSYGGAAKARDLKHLLELSLARREFYEGRRGDEGEDKNILRESLLSEL